MYKFASGLRVRLVSDKVQLFLLRLERVALLTVVCSIWVMALNTCVVRKFWSVSGCKAFLATIEYLTWKLLPFRIKVESFFSN